MATKSVLLLAACLAIGVSARDATAAGNSPETIRKVDSIDPAKINEDLKAGVPTIDVAIYLCEERGKPHGFAAAPKDLVASFQRAQEIFADAGVQLKLLWVRRREVPKDWLSLQANDVRGVPSPPEVNKYVGYRAAKWGLTKKSEEAFEGIIEAKLKALNLKGSPKKNVKGSKEEGSPKTAAQGKKAVTEANLKEVWTELQAAVAAGKLTKAEAVAKMRAIKKAKLSGK